MTGLHPPELEIVAAEVEAHVGRSGWDRGPALFALVRADRFAADEPELAAQLGLDAAGRSLTPVEQEPLPEGPLDETLAQIAWPDTVEGCALSQEVVLLPPDAEAAAGNDPAFAAAHPQRREARLVAAVLRDRSSAVVLRLRRAAGGEEADGQNAGGQDDDGQNDDGRNHGGPDDELLTGPDLAPNLVAALLATLEH